jgi:hypothetical protein
LGSLNGESRLLQFSESRILQYEPSLQDRVSLLETFVQTQNMGKTSKALRAALHSDADDADDADDAQSEMDLYDLSNPNSELDSSWKQKVSASFLKLWYDFRRSCSMLSQPADFFLRWK